MRTFASIVLAVIAITFTMPTVLGATASRTWVSHSGTAANANLSTPCTPQQPCDTFANALSVTGSGGEIDCLDTGTYVPASLTINQSVTIDCGGQIGAIDTGHTFNGIIINNASAVVTLRNLTFNGNNTDVAAGVLIQSAAVVTIENCVIQNFNGAGGSGISVSTSNPLQLYVTNTLILNNSSSSQNGGIVIAPTGSGATQFVLNHVRLENNQSAGFFVQAVNGTGAVTGVIRDSVVTGTANAGIAAVTSINSSLVIVSLDHTDVLNNGTGVLSQNNNAVVILNNSTVQANGTGLAAGNGGAIYSYGNNPINGNSGGIGTAPTVIGLH